MKNYQNKFSFLILFGLLLSFSNTYSQSVNNDVSTYNWFDKTVGKTNLDIINGPAHHNPYTTLGKNNIYLNNQYESGTVVYEGQTYYNVALKYDIYRDILVLNPFESENIGINTIQDKVESFSIQGKNFIKINRKDNNPPEFTNGYYEEYEVAPDFIFYIKHHKDVRKTIKEAQFYYSYTSNNKFFLYYKNEVLQINGKNDVVALFPEEKKKINEFYLMNRDLKKSDLDQFMKNLIKYVYSSIPAKI